MGSRQEVLWHHHEKMKILGEEQSELGPWGICLLKIVFEVLGMHFRGNVQKRR